MIRLILLTIVTLSLFSCKEEKANTVENIEPTMVSPQAEDKEAIRWKGTQVHDLTNGTAQLRLPIAWERSTQANGFAKEGLPVDKEVLDVIKSIFSQMNYEADVLDVFEKKDAEYRSLFILNTDTISMTRASVSELTRNIQAGYQKLDEEKPDVLIKNLGHKYLDDPGHKMLRFKYSFNNPTDKRPSYLNIYFITTLYRSFIIYEISDTEEDSELYWWSIKQG